VVSANGARALILGHGVSVRESEIRERKKREDERRLEWLEKKERKKETGRVNPTRSFLVKPYPVPKVDRVAPLI
jgi:hypothetical protein